MSRSVSTVLAVFLVALGVLFAGAGPATASKKCGLRYSNFKNGRVTKVSCAKARKVVKAWWQKGESVCYTTKGCRVQGFRCSVKWVGYVGHGRCVAPVHRRITFTYR